MITKEILELLRGAVGRENVLDSSVDRATYASFSIKFYDLSKKIADEKAENIFRSGADVVATACPGCIIQIRDALRRRGMENPVVHIAELAAVKEDK